VKVKKEVFGEYNGRDVQKYTLVNSNGIEISCIEYGCRITKIMTPDAEGNFANIVLGHERLDFYIVDKYYLGAICGRTAGRIKNAKFTLDGQGYNLTKNNDNNNLHGGMAGFSSRCFNSSVTANGDGATVVFSYVSEDGEEGYPGKLNLEVRYTLTEDDELIMEYFANTDKTTIVNITNHSYFNLSGDSEGTIFDHKLQIDSDEYFELGTDFCPTGKLLTLQAHPFNFKEGKLIKEVFRRIPSGVDHPFLLNGDIVLSHEKSGRSMRIETDQNAVVVYTGNMMLAPKTNTAICLETQAPPDAINHEEFASIVLKPKETYSATTKICFVID